MKWIIIAISFLIAISKCQPDASPKVKITVTFHKKYDSLIDDSQIMGAFFNGWHFTDSAAEHPPTDYLNKTIHWTADTAPYMMFHFEGTRFRIYGMRDKHLGIMRVRVAHRDDKPEIRFFLDTLIDNFRPARLDTSGLLYDSESLPWSNYTIMVENTGMQNDSATNHHLIIDAVELEAEIPVIIQNCE